MGNVRVPAAMRGGWVALVAILSLAAAGCAGPTPRDPAVVAAIETGAERYAAEQAAIEAQRLETFLTRFEAIARGETADDTFDVLLFSGGSEWGAFGAGYTAEWSELGAAADVPVPEFDVIAGISTGALMAAYVASGEAERFAALEEFYRGVSPDWIEFRGLLALLSPATTALVDNERVREEVSGAVDDALIADFRRAHADGRQILVGTVSLDYGAVRYWDLGQVAATEPAPKPKIVDLLMAATTIAGIFPPVEVDGSLYADLGYVEGIPAFRGRNIDAFAEAWRARNGATPPPLMRLWLVYNIPIGLEPDPVELSLVPLAMRGYDALVQGSFKNPVETAFLLRRISEQNRTPLLEVNWIAVPSDFEEEPDAPRFDPRTANALADLGRELAARPGGGWRQDAPD
jgi:predicted acylesterase/phospholipase RssA